jgi:hypothetical protein
VEAGRVAPRQKFSVRKYTKNVNNIPALSTIATRCAADRRGITVLTRFLPAGETAP